MAKPIEPTPDVYGEDAERLLVSLYKGVSREVMAKRVARAKEIARELERPKGKQSMSGSDEKDRAQIHVKTIVAEPRREIDCVVAANSRAKSLAITKLDEMEFWLLAAVVDGR